MGSSVYKWKLQLREDLKINNVLKPRGQGTGERKDEIR